MWEQVASRWSRRKGGCVLGHLSTALWPCPPPTCHIFLMKCLHRAAQGLRPRGHEPQMECLLRAGLLPDSTPGLTCNSRERWTGAHHTIPTRPGSIPVKGLSVLALLGFEGLGDSRETFPTDNLATGLSALCVLGCRRGCGNKGFQPSPCPEGAYLLCFA